MTGYFLLYPLTIPGFLIQISVLKQAKKLRNEQEGNEKESLFAEK
jgi:hypothetical protein